MQALLYRHDITFHDEPSECTIYRNRPMTILHITTIDYVFLINTK